MNANFIPALLTAVLVGLLPESSRGESVVVQWEKIYNGQGYGYFTAAVAVDSAGNVVVVGGITQTDIISLGTYIAKYAAADGALRWERRRNPPPPPTGSRRFNDVAADRADNVIVTGEDEGNYYTAKYAAANGALLWERRYNVGGGGTRVAVDGAGNVIVTGTQFYTAKYAAVSGSTIWERLYNGPGIGPHRAQDMAVDGQGNVIVTGKSRNPPGSASSFDYYTAKYAAGDGALLWEKRYQGPRTHNVATGVMVDSQGNVIVTGTSTFSFGTGSGTEYRCSVKYAAADGALLWEKCNQGPDGIWDRRAFVALDDADNVITTNTFSYSANSYVANLSKYAADGALLWNITSTAFRVGGIFVEDGGNVIVTGSAAGSGGSRDMLTSMFSAADGAPLWEKRYNGASNLDDTGIAIAVDSAGAIIVAGEINYNASGGDTYTVKYDSVDHDGDNDGLPDWWEIEHFGSTEGQGALDDTDGDGAVELLELAFGTDPRSSGSVPAPVAVVENAVGEDAYLTTTIAKHPGVNYVVETGATLDGDFTATSTVILIDSAATLKVRDNVPVGTQPERFLRVQVTAAP